MVFDSRPTLGTSQRTGIDHISFSYPDLTAKMAELEAVGVRGSGVRLQRFEDGSTLRDVAGLFKLGFIFDPWGTRIELVEDHDTLGFHHIHLSATDPAATLAWVPGAVRRRERASARPHRRAAHGRHLAARDAGRGRAGGRRRAGPSTTSAFAVPEMDEAAAQLRSDGVAFLTEPVAPEGGRTAARRAFIGGPDNVSLALVEEGFAGVDAEFDAPVDITTELREYTAPRTPWGVPDFQGVWTGDAAHGIPLQRPDDLAEVEVLTPEQAAARRERGTLGSIWGYESEWRDTTLGYVRSAPSRQVAMVIDPPDGRLPARTPEGERLLAEARAARRPIAEGPRGSQLVGAVHHPQPRPDPRRLQQRAADRTGAEPRRPPARDDSRDPSRPHRRQSPPRGRHHVVAG